MTARLEHAGAPLTACPACAADLTTTAGGQGVLAFVNLSADKFAPNVTTAVVAVGKSDGVFADKDEDGYEFDPGKIVECQCQDCGHGLDDYVHTT